MAHLQSRSTKECALKRDNLSIGNTSSIIMDFQGTFVSFRGSNLFGLWLRFISKQNFFKKRNNLSHTLSETNSKFTPENKPKSPKRKQ